MSTNESANKNLIKIKWVFMIMGILEIFVITLFSTSIFGLIIGLLTIVPALISLEEKRIKWNYVLGVFGIIKYNPFIWIGLISFIFGDLQAAKEKGTELIQNIGYTVAVGLEFLFVLLVITLFILSIILLNKTAKQIRINKKGQEQY